MSDQAYYSKGFSKVISDTHAWRNVENYIPYIIPYLNKSQKLLDVGCGPGTILKDLGNYVAEVIGIEPMAELIELSKAQDNLPENVHFQKGLAYEIPFEDNSFDVVHALQVIVHLADPAKALREMLRVCKKDGYVCVKDGDLDSTVVYPEKYADVILNAISHRPTTLMIAGRLLKERALTAGYSADKMTMSGLVWYISSAEQRKKQYDMMRPRIEKGYEVTEHSKYDKKTVVDTLEQWANDDAAVLIFVSGELVYRK